MTTGRTNQVSRFMVLIIITFFVIVLIFFLDAEDA